jgi:eukaryotic-like serine/threonine-protein kinase
MYSYQWLNQLDQAKARAQEARAHNVDSPWIPLVLYTVCFLEHDSGGMERQAATAMGNKGVEDQMLFLESETAAYRGEFAKSRELTRRAADAAQRADEKETAAEYQAHAAIREAIASNLDFAKQEAQAALAQTHGRQVEALSAVAVGLAGDSAQAERLAADLGKRFPEDTVEQFDYLPMIHAAVALHRSDGGRAVAAMASASPYELGTTNSSLTFALYPVYFRAQAYLCGKPGTAAVTEFQKILDHPGVVGNQPIRVLSAPRIGPRLCTLRRHRQSQGELRGFLIALENAPDAPLLKQAQAEYAKLK